MKFAVVCLCALASSLSSSQSMGTKKDIVTGTQTAAGPAVQPMDMFQMLLAVCIVAALVKWVLPKAVARLGRRITTPLGSTIKLEESASFGGGQLQIITARNRTLLLCVATTGVSCLADLTEPDTKPEPGPAFFDVLDAADPAKAVVTASALEEEMSIEQAMAMIQAAKERSSTSQDSRLDRLNRLMGS